MWSSLERLGPGILGDGKKIRRLEEAGVKSQKILSTWLMNLVVIL